VKKYLKLLRVRHYLKNMLVFFPLFFSINFFDAKSLKSVIGFMCFSFISSTVYILNDIADRHMDALHPTKKNRPIASGAVSVQKALVIAVVLFTAAMVINLVFLGYLSFIWLLIYLLINIAYSFGIKNIPLLDICVLSLGFLIRVFYGGVIIGVPVSHWLYLTIMSISFFMGYGKRRNEIKKTDSSARNVLSLYSSGFLEKNMYVCMALAIVFYSLWAAEQKEYLIWTIPVIVVICGKYSLNIEGDSSGDPVDVILGDKVLLACAAFYAALMFVLLYVV